MLGRLIDQLFPQHVHEPAEADIVTSFRSSHPGLSQYKPETPWGDTISLLRAGDLNLINLETSVTTSTNKWPNKVFNYRMHPANVTALQAAGIDYAGLANNHTLDFREEGLKETVSTVKDAGIAFAGAGDTAGEATRPAVLRLPRGEDGNERMIHIWAASDHPTEWATVKGFHSIDYAQATRTRLQALLHPRTASHCSPPTVSPVLKIFSVHWGPNYTWQPSQEIRDLAHFLVDSCDIDIVHGHSSHHVQGVEKYHDKLIIYGCGDLVDDYALVPEYRNDLSGVWSVQVEASDGGDRESSRLKLNKLELFPTKIERFAARRLKAEEPDSQWIRERVRILSAAMGTNVQIEEGGEGRAIVDLS